MMVFVVHKVFLCSVWGPREQRAAAAAAHALFAKRAINVCVSLV